jgi:predicted nucleotidyltransferase component of viral defense system
MQNNQRQIVQQIRLVADELNLEDFVIEKDLYVTQAISIISKIAHEFFDIIFQGGTSLAKAHRIIERMSEDCDFRIQFKNIKKKLSKEFKRKTLRHFRHNLIDTLREKGFSIEDSHVKVRNEGQFIGIRANYPSLYSRINGIKPFLALEFFLAEVKTPQKIN